MEMHFKIKRSYKIDLNFRSAYNEIFSDAEFLAELGELSRKENIPIDDAKKLCGIHLKSISADHTANHFFWSLMRFIVRKRIIESFRNIHCKNIEVVSRLLEKKLVVIVPNHKSVYDFVILYYLLVTKTGFVPIVPAAEVFDVFPVGKVFRKIGAYFVKREYNDEFYPLVFKHYVMLISKFELVHMFFIEGGRNKSGGYSEPKVGLLKYIIDGRKKHRIKKEIAFVPANISYDFVPESDIVIKEHVSGKRNHIANSLIKYLTKSDLGNCHVTFGSPIYLSHFLGKRDDYEAVKELGDLIIKKIKEMAVITPISLLCFTIYNVKEKSINEEELEKKLRQEADLLKQKKLNLKFIGAKNSGAIIEEGMEKGLLRSDGKGSIIIDKNPAVLYYAKNILDLLQKK